MRRHAKAATAGSTKRQDGGLGRFVPTLAVVLACSALGAPGASAAAPTIVSTTASSVTSNAAVLKASINPGGQATTYHFEYGLADCASNSCTSAPIPDGNVGTGSAVLKVAWEVDGLTPDTTYHFRIVAANSGGTTPGPDVTFKTYPTEVQNTNCPNQEFRTGSSAALPDCRAYEMVSPVDKNGGDIAALPELAFRLERRIQSAVAGGKITYSSFQAFGDSPSARFMSQYMATRGVDGWSNHGLSAVLGRTTGGSFAPIDLRVFFQAFSPDLSTSWFFDNNEVPLTTDGVLDSTNYYMRDNTDDTVRWIGDNLYRVMGFTDDLSHVALIDEFADRGVFDFSGGELHRVSVLPNGTPAGNGLLGTNYFTEFPERGASVENAISSDGSRMFWTLADGRGPVYVRENPAEPQSAVSGETCTEPTKACTIPVSGSVTTKPSQFWTASDDGSHALFSFDPDDGGPLTDDLYDFDVDAKTPSLIAHNVIGVLGASEDLSYVYFVSTDNLASGATVGQRNLYVKHGVSVRFIATLATLDTYDSGSIDETTVNGDPVVSGYNVVSASPLRRASRVTPDGRHIVFQSVRSLTGYDNSDANNSEPDVEVFTYDADADNLTCVSCNPSGVRPVGKPLRMYYWRKDKLVEAVGSPARRWTAAWIPTWEYATYGSRVLSEDGNRVFFNSYDALLPQDTNGAQDVYQWEAAGSGDCSKPTGCLSLISSGQSPQDSEFLDASPDGKDVFFETNASLLSQDPGLIDIYDAREEGGFPAPPTHPECAGDACQSVPAAPNDVTPASALFRGVGNAATPPDCSAEQRRATALRRQASRLNGEAARSGSPARSKRLKQQAARAAERARALSGNARRCRRLGRGAGQ